MFEKERITSYGCAAPTFGRGMCDVVAARVRPKVGATRGKFTLQR
jgi:hypothetical protein